MQTKLLGIIGVDFAIKDELLIRYSAFIRSWRKNETVHQLFINFKKAYDSVSRDVLYDILIKHSILLRPVTLIKMCVNQTYSKVHISNNLMYFLYGMVWNNKMLYCHYFSTLLSSMSGRYWNWMKHISFCFMLMMLIYWVKTHIP